jgi:RimJ/RimL family protein N-acetyltransferase
MKIADTDRLVLRTAEPGDDAFYLALLNDPGFITHIADRNVRTVEAARQALLDGPIAMQAALGHSMYVVELKDGGTPIGMSGLIQRDALPGPDIGYAFLAAYCAQGYAFEAACAVLLHAHALGIPRIMAITAPDNAASIGLLEKCGLRYQGAQQVPPYETMSNIYAADLPLDVVSGAPPGGVR